MKVRTSRGPGRPAMRHEACGVVDRERFSSPAAAGSPAAGREDGPPGEVRGAGLRPSRPHPGPRERAAPHGLGADRGLALLAALLRLADHEPAAGRGSRGSGGGLGVLRGRAPLPRHRQLPGRRGRGRRAAPALHAGLPGVRPPARLHHRPRARAPAPRQAARRAQRPLRARASRAPSSGTSPRCAPPPGAGAWMRIHGTTHRRPLEVFEEEERPALAPWDGEPYELPDWRTATVHGPPDTRSVRLCPPTGGSARYEAGAISLDHLDPVGPGQRSSRGRCPGRRSRSTPPPASSRLPAGARRGPPPAPARAARPRSDRLSRSGYAEPGVGPSASVRGDHSPACKTDAVGKSFLAQALGYAAVR